MIILVDYKTNLNFDLKEVVRAVMERINTGKTVKIQIGSGD